MQYQNAHPEVSTSSTKGRMLNDECYIRHSSMSMITSWWWMFSLGTNHTARIPAAGKAHSRSKVRRLNYPILLFNITYCQGNKAADEKNFTQKGLLRQGEVERRALRSSLHVHEFTTYDASLIMIIVHRPDSSICTYCTTRVCNHRLLFGRRILGL